MSPIKVGRWWWWRPLSGATLCLHLSKLGVDLKRFFCSLEPILRMASRGTSRWSIQIVISSCVQLPIGVRSVAARCDVESRANLRWDTPLNHPRTARKSTTYHSFRSSGLILKEIFHSNRRLTPGVKTRKGNVPFVYGIFAESLFLELKMTGLKIRSNIWSCLNIRMSMKLLGTSRLDF